MMSSQVFALSGTNRDENMRFQVWKSIMKGKVLKMEIDGVTMYMHFDSHANMVVLGRECLVIAERKDKCSVSAFVDDVGSLSSVSVVDAVLAYDCPRQARTILLFFRNALYIPTMTHHLMPPFILREVGITVNDVPKIHCEDLLQMITLFGLNH